MLYYRDDSEYRVQGVKMAIYERIRDYLDERKMQQTFLVEKTGMSKQAVSELLRGHRRISVDEYQTICDAFGVSLDYFVDQDDLISRTGDSSSESRQP